MRGNVGNYILITILIMLIFGVISFGDVLSVIFYIFLGIVFLIVLGIVLFRFRLRRIRREMEQGMRSGAGQRTSARSRQSAKSEGDVTIEQTRTSKNKTVNSQVGDYVDYEDIEEIEEK